jgi:hypothetical protein
VIAREKGGVASDLSVISLRSCVRNMLKRLEIILLHSASCDVILKSWKHPARLATGWDRDNPVTGGRQLLASAGPDLTRSRS